VVKIQARNLVFCGSHVGTTSEWKDCVRADKPVYTIMQNFTPIGAEIYMYVGLTGQKKTANLVPCHGR